MPRFDVFHPIQFQGFGDFRKHTRGDLQALSRQFEDFASCLEIIDQREKNRHDEPAKETAQKIDPKVFPLRRRAAPDDFFRRC